MFFSLVKRMERREQLQEFLSSQMAAAVMNFSMSPPKRTVQPGDLMPSEVAKKRRRGSSAEREALADQVRELFAKIKQNQGAQGAPKVHNS
jgi:hypothetical protein